MMRPLKKPPMWFNIPSKSKNTVSQKLKEGGVAGLEAYCDMRLNYYHPQYGNTYRRRDEWEIIHQLVRDDPEGFAELEKYYKDNYQRAIDKINGVPTPDYPPSDKQIYVIRKYMEVNGIKGDVTNIKTSKEASKIISAIRQNEKEVL